MGRYYTGDINGKFGFGCQSSDDITFFGGDASEPNHLSCSLEASEIPEAIKITEKLIRKFKRDFPKCKLTINTDADDFTNNMVDNDWYQNSKNGLLSSRIYMGLQIAQFYREHPEMDIYFDAEC